MIKILIIQLTMKKIEIFIENTNRCDKIKNFSYGGRLADYAYYDMDMTIFAALKKFDQIKKRLK